MPKITTASSLSGDGVMRLSSLMIWFAAGTVVLAACSAPATPRQTTAASSGQPSASTQARTLTMLARYEVTDLAPKIPGGSSPIVTKRLFNAFIALIDSVGTARPYLVEALPQVNTDSWKVFPDGRMETTYRLRPNLTWQDGAPLTADDFVFAWQVYRDPGMSVFISTPQDRMEDVSAPDQRTLVIKWSSPYPDAAVIKDADLDPLPRHLLGQQFTAYQQDPATRDAFLGLPYWTTEYIGLGPYKLTRWEQGAAFEGVAFDGHALGKPRIERLIFRIMPDENTTLSNVLAGNTDFTTDFTLRFEHALILQRDWAASGRGAVILKRGGVVTNTIQNRPEIVGHPGQLDARVRRAMAYSLDRQSLNDGVFEGQGFLSENMVPDDLPYFRDADQAITKYPFDPRRTEQLMNEAGFSKDAEGFFASQAGDRFRTEFRAIAGPEFERGQAILMDSWRKAGIDVTGAILPANLVRDREMMHAFSGMATRGGGTLERTFTSSEIGTSANRWVGDNRSGWHSPEYDRLYLESNSTLALPERTRQEVSMLKILSEEVPHFVLYSAIQVNTRVAALKGPEAGTPGFGTFTPGAHPYWNVHEWAFDS